MWDNFLFIGLPYAVIVIVLIGTIFRYHAFGFKVSSLSSQFLESKELFLRMYLVIQKKLNMFRLI